MDDPTETSTADIARRVATLRAEVAWLVRQEAAQRRRPWLVRVLIPGRYIDRGLRRARRALAAVEQELREMSDRRHGPP